ncbi:MAG: SAM-dependent methyltransferase [Parasphingorhabdus sp.]|jgi:SAM-dependent methyltransferase
MSKTSDQEISANYDEVIKQHYDKVANAEKDAPSSTMADAYIRQQETEFILRRINDYLAKNARQPEAVKIMDVGCGNGYSLEVLQKEFPTAQICGLEYTDSLREVAVKRFESSPVEIYPGDIRQAETIPDDIDVLICQRVLINLLNPEDQARALQNLVDKVGSNGLLIFIECFNSGLNQLNDARSEFGIEKLPPAHHNLYLQDDFFAHQQLDIFDNSEENYLSTHYFVTRVLHQAFLDGTGSEFKRNSHFVSFFTRALNPGVGEYTPLRFLCYKKR